MYRIQIIKHFRTLQVDGYKIYKVEIYTVHYISYSEIPTNLF